jgi:hypothetical protein
MAFKLTSNRQPQLLTSSTAVYPKTYPNTLTRDQRLQDYRRMFSERFLQLARKPRVRTELMLAYKSPAPKPGKLGPSSVQ